MANVLEIIIAAKDQATKQIGGVRKGLGDLAGGMKNLSIAVAAVYGPLAAGLGFALKKTVDYGVKLDDLMKKTGVSAESLSRLGYAAEQEGSSINGVAMAFKFLGMRMVDAEDGLMEAKRAFDRMGLTITDSQGKFKDLEGMLMEVAGRFPDLGSEAEKTSVAMDLFGRSGVELIPLLNKGQGAIRELMEEADSLGIVMSTDMAKSSKVFADGVTTMKEGLRGMALTIGKTLMPIVQEWISYGMENMPKIQEFGVQIAKGIERQVTSIGILVKWWKELGNGVRESVTAHGDLSGAQDKNVAKWKSNILVIDEQIKMLKDLTEAQTITVKQAIGSITMETEARELSAEETAKLIRLTNSRRKAQAELEIALSKQVAETTTEQAKAGAKAKEKADADAATVWKGALTDKEDAALTTHDAEQKRIEDMRDRLLEFYEWDAEQRGLQAEDILVKIEERLESEEEGTERYLALIEARTFLQEELETESAGKIALGWKSSFGKINSYSLEFGKILGSVTAQSTKQFGSAMEGMVMDGKNFKEAFDGFFKDLARSFVRAVSEMIAKWLAFKAITGIFGGIAAPIAGPALMPAMPMFQHGTTIDEPTLLTGLRTGKQGVAGEAGKEWVTPNFPGSASPSVTHLTVIVNAERSAGTLTEIADSAREGSTEAIEASLLMKRLADANQELAA